VQAEKVNEPFNDSPAIYIKEKAEARNKQLANALFEILNNKYNSLNKIDFAEENLTGIYHGQLYYLVQELKKSPEFEDESRREDQLYIPILSTMFGCKVLIRKGKHTKGTVDFYCVPTQKWIEKFGKK